MVWLLFPSLIILLYVRYVYNSNARAYTLLYAMLNHIGVQTDLSRESQIYLSNIAIDIYNETIKFKSPIEHLPLIHNDGEK